MNDGAKGRAKGRLAALCNMFADGYQRDDLVILATTTDIWTSSLFSLILLLAFFVTARFLLSLPFISFFDSLLETGYLL